MGNFGREILSLPGCDLTRKNFSIGLAVAGWWSAVVYYKGRETIGL